MTAKRNDSDDTERLPDAAARRLLERASELEATRSAEVSLAELRDVAREAGIGPIAFDQALAELRERREASEAARVDVPAARSSTFRIAALTLLLTFGFIFTLAMFFFIARVQV